MIVCVCGCPSLLIGRNLSNYYFFNLMITIAKRVPECVARLTQEHGFFLKCK